MKITIKDVAAAAGVSPSTVSRALHNNPRISQEVRDRIRAVADQMGFHPNQMARSLVSRKTRIIGVAFPGVDSQSLAHPFYPQVLQGLGQVAAQRRYSLLLGMTPKESNLTDTVHQLVDSGYVSGLLLLAAEENLVLGELGVPVVLIGRPQNGECAYFVDTDNVEAGRVATEYLLSRGHRRILLLGYDKQYIVTVDRRAGYEQALSRRGVPFCREWVVPSPFLNNTTDRALLESIFRKKEHPTAVVCMDDAQAIGLAGCLSAIGLSVPGDVSIVSFNNTQAGQYHHPPLTSIDVEPYRLGTEAMDMLLDLVKETPVSAPSRQVAFRLVERDSVRTIPEP